MQPLEKDNSQSVSMSNDDEVLVRVDGVSKKFCRDLKKSLWYGLKDVASELLPIQNSASKIQNSEDALRPGEFWANKDISFELRRGECLGLIGHNGAGKTTLLKMLNGLIKPDKGSITMRGRVGALIALGAGFNPILTGRENIYINASVLGLSKKEIDEKFEEIVDFAEIDDFIDMPVQNYSSGMQVRLGFAVATALDPDILIVDEVLAVGDARFRRKCYDTFRKLRARNCSIIIVSHGLSQIATICDEAIVLNAGEISYKGAAPKAVSHLLELMQDQPKGKSRKNGAGPAGQGQDCPVQIVGLEAHGPGPEGKVFAQETATIRVLLDSTRAIEHLNLQLSFWHEERTILIALMNSRQEGFFFDATHGRMGVDLEFPRLALNPGSYFIKASVQEADVPTPLSTLGFEDEPYLLKVHMPENAGIDANEIVMRSIVHLEGDWSVNPI